MVRRDHLVEAKLIKELPLISVLPPHHRRLSCCRLSRNHCSLGSSSPFFDSIGPLQTFQLLRRMAKFHPVHDVTKGIGTMKIDGRCHCGYITFEAEIEPDKTLLCNCAD